MGVKLQSSSGGSVEIAAPVTASNYVLTAPAKTATLLTTASTGTVLQVASTTVSGAFSTSSTVYVDRTDLSATITPISASSRILVLVNITPYNTGSTTQPGEYANIVRGSTQICESVVSIPNTSKATQISMSYLDSPSTTLATTYKVQVKTESGGTFSNISGYIQTITLMEIAG